MEKIISLAVILLTTILFADFIGIMRSRVFDEKQIQTEYLHRSILEKGVGLFIVVSLLLFFRA